MYSFEAFSKLHKIFKTVGTVSKILCSFEKASKLYTYVNPTLKIVVQPQQPQHTTRRQQQPQQPPTAPPPPHYIKYNTHHAHPLYRLY